MQNSAEGRYTILAPYRPLPGIQLSGALQHIMLLLRLVTSTVANIFMVKLDIYFKAVTKPSNCQW